jgi:hypothetical protein
MSNYMSLLCDLSCAQEQYEGLLQAGETPKNVHEIRALREEVERIRAEIQSIDDSYDQRWAAVDTSNGINPHNNPFAFLESDNPLEWDHFFHEPTTDLLCLNPTGQNVLNFVVEVKNDAGHTLELERCFFLPPAFEDEQGCLRSDLLDEDEDGFYYLKNCDATAAYFKPWGPINKTYTPLYIEYIRP